MSDPKMSARTCGCDPGANYLCAWHSSQGMTYVPDPVAAPTTTTPPGAASTGVTPATTKDQENGGALLAADAPYAYAAFTAMLDQERRNIEAAQRELVEDSRGVATPAKGQKPTNAKGPFATNKVPLSLVPAAANVYCALALADGGAKYGIANYRAAGCSARIYIDALRRHIDAWYDGGEDIAEDSGVPHLGHAMACLAIIIDAHTQGMLNDDRPISNRGLARLMEQSQDVIEDIRLRHAHKNPRHYTIADNGIQGVTDPKEQA